MSLLRTAIDFLLHIDKHLTLLIAEYGTTTYGIIFLIIFAETGLVFTPFLPGDSLLFTAGALAAQGTLSIFLILLIIAAAAILGDTVNYFIGKKLGETILKKKWIKEEHVTKTTEFYHKYGKKTIILARFIPIIRTFAPFIAGIGVMNYPTFLLYNIIGGILWVSFFVLLGYFFGNIPYVQTHFGSFIILIIIISLIPLIIEGIKMLKEKRKQENHSRT